MELQNNPSGVSKGTPEDDSVIIIRQGPAYKVEEEQDEIVPIGLDGNGKPMVIESTKDEPIVIEE
jgi:hypothetical protein